MGTANNPSVPDLLRRLAEGSTSRPRRLAGRHRSHQRDLIHDQRPAAVARGLAEAVIAPIYGSSKFPAAADPVRRGCQIRIRNRIQSVVPSASLALESPFVGASRAIDIFAAVTAQSDCHMLMLPLWHQAMQGPRAAPHATTPTRSCQLCVAEGRRASLRACP